MIRTFADERTATLYVTGRSRRFPPSVLRRTVRKLEQLNAALVLSDLRVPPSNRLHALTGDRGAQHSISINDQWRFYFSFEDGEASDVEICDYR